MGAAASTGSQTISAGTQRTALDSQEEKHCNGSLKKHSGSGIVDDSSGQRYSADPTVFPGLITQRGGTDEDGYVAPRKDKSSSGKRDLECRTHCKSNCKKHLCVYYISIITTITVTLDF